jgi:nitrogen regulatory protein PII
MRKPSLRPGAKGSTHSTGFYRVTIVVDPERSQALIDAAVGLGASRAFIVRSRGVLHKKKLGVLTLPGFSPSFDMINLIVPRESLDLVLDTMVRVGKLSHFGAGAIYATHIHDLWYAGTTLFSGSRTRARVKHEFDYQRNLIAINCICQLEHAEEIAHRAMAAGSPSPTICYGYGHGIRDRLGFFLQLTINPKKEFIELVVGSAEADRIFAEMVESGRLDQPAMGFIFTRHVDIGLINTMSFQNTTPYAATMEQVIKAIDQLKGDTRWRSTGTLTSTAGASRLKKLHGLVSLTCIVNRGLGDACSLAAMEAGASGTSTYFANASPIETHSDTGLEESDEREIISLTVGQAQVPAVVHALTTMSELKGTPTILFAYPAPQALTYLKS